MPISLINVDTKIAFKVLASRMQNILTSIISHNQTAYVKGRYIGESIRLIIDILEYTEDNSIGGILFRPISKKHSIQLNTRLYLLLSNPLASDFNSFTALEQFFEVQRAV